MSAGAQEKNESLAFAEDWTISATVDAEEFERFTCVLSAVVHEAKVTFRPGWIECTAADPAKVCLVEKQAPCNGFAAKAEVGVDIEKLADALDAFGPTEEYDIVVDSADEELRMADPYGEEKIVPLIDPMTVREIPDYADLEHDNEFTTESYRLKAKVGVVAEDANASSGYSKVHLTPEGDSLRVQVGDWDDPEYDWSLEADAGDGATNVYSGDYMAAIVDALPFSEDVTVRMSESTPIELLVGESLMFALAPHISVNGGEDSE